MSDTDTFCIPSNPDISGVGVRSAIYVQNFLSFVPALFALWDTEVSPTELQSLETQSTTILVTALALLIATFVLGENPPANSPTQGLSNFHVAIILNLSWMNNTNTFIYFLLRVYHEIEEHRKLLKEGTGGDGSGPEVDVNKLTFWSIFWSGKIAKKLFWNPVIVIGSLHLSMMSAAGIWLWVNPATFPNSQPCAMGASLFVVGKRVSFASPGLRIFSLLVYSFFVVPGLNLLPPLSLLLVPYLIHDKVGPKYKSGPSDRSLWDLWHVIAGLAILALIVLILLVDIEVAVRDNPAPFLEPGDGAWTFGQILALVLLLLPIRDIFDSLHDRSAQRLGQQLLSELREDPAISALGTIKAGANIGIKDKSGNTALALAAEKGYLEVVKTVVEKLSGPELPREINAKNPHGNTPLHLAIKHGHLEVVKYLVQKGANANLPDRSGNTPLLLATRNEHWDVARCLSGGGAV